MGLRGREGLGQGLQAGRKGWLQTSGLSVGVQGWGRDISGKGEVAAVVG